ncbi:hypothetical protein RDI58_017621 [Solanum bulbocastanum]|uniref:Uncharacterized protein n=1 Tax=Solanum bulbocastanum TaxID=147425 RepID=A0AAN8Y9D1_SOLBU
MDCKKEEATKARVITEEMMEKDDVPEGSFKLDPTSIPAYELGIFASSIDQRVTTNFMDFVNSAENWVASNLIRFLNPSFTNLLMRDHWRSFTLVNVG